MKNDPKTQDYEERLAQRLAALMIAEWRRMGGLSAAQPIEPPRPDRLLDTIELGRRIDVSPRTIERWRTTGLVGPAFVKTGRRVFYRESVVEQWITDCTQQHTNEISVANQRVGKKKR